MNEEYRTRNIAFSAFLIARGAPIPEIHGQRGNAEFRFLDEQGTLGWEYEQFKADAPVPVQQLLWAQRELRAQLERAFGPRNNATSPALTAGGAARNARR